MQTHCQHLKGYSEAENVNIPADVRLEVEGNPHLDSGLGQSQPLAQFLSHEGVRVVRLVEEPFQLVQLLQGEVSATPPLLQLALCILILRLHVLLFLLTLVYPC